MLCSEFESSKNIRLLHHTIYSSHSFPNQMGKKMKFPFLFKPNDSTTTSTSAAAAAATPWPWPACVNSPKTLSFRANANANILKTMNPAYLHDKSSSDLAETPYSFSSIRRRGGGGGSESFSSADGTHDETAVIGGLKSARLLFDPGETSSSSSILEEASKWRDFPYGGSAKITAMDSDDPILDFRASMAEMVEAHRLRSWECLEELLACYLMVNGKSNHGYIVKAFVDLLRHIALQAHASAIDEEHCSSSSTTTQCSFTSPLSFSSSSNYSSTSPCLSLPEKDEEVTAAKRSAARTEGV